MVPVNLDVRECLKAISTHAQPHLRTDIHVEDVSCHFVRVTCLRDHLKGEARCIGSSIGVHCITESISGLPPPVVNAIAGL